MRLTKYAHSCFTLEKDGKVLVVDPGSWTPDFIVPSNVTAVVVTHEHMDHFDEEKLKAIIDQNPDAIIYGPADVVAKIPELPAHTVSAGDTIEVGGFSLKFIGGVHATIHKDFHPQFQNVGIIVNDLLYHPGDSLALPDQPIKVLSVPIVAPWEKVSESMDFMMNIKPEIAFPSHDTMLSESGISLYDRWHNMAAEKHGIKYERIDGSIEIQ